MKISFSPIIVAIAFTPACALRPTVAVQSPAPAPVAPPEEARAVESTASTPSITEAAVVAETETATATPPDSSTTSATETPLASNEPPPVASSSDSTNVAPGEPREEELALVLPAEPASTETSSSPEPVSSLAAPKDPDARVADPQLDDSRLETCFEVK